MGAKAYDRAEESAPRRADLVERDCGPRSPTDSGSPTPSTSAPDRAQSTLPPHGDMLALHHRLAVALVRTELALDALRAGAVSSPGSVRRAHPPQRRGLQYLSTRQEIHNYSGLEDLALGLARRGYVAFAPDINAHFTFAFGEARGLDRINQLVALHLDAIVAADRGAGPALGIELQGKVDLARAAIVGHSQGGDFASMITRDGLPNGPSVEWSALLLVAPPLVFLDALPVADVPLAVVLPACDGDVRGLDGQRFYESVRTAAQRESLATSVYLERANHNGFNSILDSEWSNGASPDRPDCDPLLEPDRQQEFLAAYAADFLGTVFGRARATNALRASRSRGDGPGDGRPAAAAWPARRGRASRASARRHRRGRWPRSGVLRRGLHDSRRRPRFSSL